jgi:hypothetical protein
VALYVTIGVMSAAGSVYIAKSIFSAKVEQIFFGLFLIPIAGFYLAFTAYFGDKDAWQLEATAVAVFAVFGLMGVRVPSVLIVGYLLHGLWDTVHEFNPHAGGPVLGPRQTHSLTVSFAPLMTFSWRHISTHAAQHGAPIAAVPPSRKNRE